jgi:hypothetical protein
VFGRERRRRLGDPDVVHQRSGHRGHPRRFVVLTEREQKTLREVQRGFVAEDPDFARSVDDVGQRHSTYSLHWAYAMPRGVYTVAIVVAVALGVLMLLVRAPGTALLFAALATMISVIRRRRDEPGPSSAWHEVDRW